LNEFLKEAVISKKKNGKNDFYFFGQVIEPGTEQKPETKQNKHCSDGNAEYFIEFTHWVL
jgi:hypothetical protein